MSDDILSPAAVADPYSYLRELRENDPVAWDARYRSWVITRHDDNAAALKDLRFSSDRITPFIVREQRRERPNIDLIETFNLLNGWLVFRDPPEHMRMRRLVHKSFSPRIIAAMKSEIENVTDGLIETVVASTPSDGVVDLRNAIAYPLPAVVIAGMLGVPGDDRDLFKQWSDDISALVFGALEDEDRHDRAKRGMDNLTVYISKLVDRARRRPADDLATAFVQAQDEADGLTDSEIIATCINLLFGGHETTTNLIANGLLALLQHPNQADKLRSDPSLTASATEEFLRFDGPAKAVARIAAADIDLRGRTIKTGDRVFLMPSSANHDPEVFDRPDELDITRTANPHLGFGTGSHYCLGAPLARLEASIVISKVLQRFPTLQLAPETLAWNPVILTRGLTKLPVVLNGVASRARSSKQSP